MKDLKQFLAFLKGQKNLYIGAILVALITSISEALIPIVIKSTVDFLLVPTHEKASFLRGGAHLLFNIRENEVTIKHIGIVAFFAMLLLVIIRGVFSFLKAYLSTTAAESIVKTIQTRLYKHIQFLPFSYHHTTDSGDLLQRCTSDVNTIRLSLATQLIEIINTLFVFCYVLIIMITMSPLLTLISISLLPLLIISNIIFLKKTHASFMKLSESEAKMTTTLRENLTGIRVIKALNRTEFEKEKFEAQSANYKQKRIHFFFIISLSYGTAYFLVLAQTGVTLAVGSILTVKGIITPGTLIAFLTYVSMIAWLIRIFQRSLIELNKGFVASKRIHEILEMPTELTELYEQNKKPTEKIRGDVEFSQVCFSYPTNPEKKVLIDISFKLVAGKTLGVIGPTGSGKSALLELLVRLYDYDSGSILIDNKELKNFDKAFIRSNIGLVLQEPFLYEQTIAENIRFSVPGSSKESILEASHAAAIHDDIIGFDQQYETLIGERGISLSGGQKQRIALARELIRDAPLIMFDDSLSALDSSTEAKIREKLKKAKEDSIEASIKNPIEKSKNLHTRIIVTHRISTIADADLIIVLDHGRIIQRGIHEELLKEEGLYKQLFEIQTLTERLS